MVRAGLDRTDPKLLVKELNEHRREVYTLVCDENSWTRQRNATGALTIDCVDNA